MIAIYGFSVPLTCQRVAFDEQFIPGVGRLPPDCEACWRGKQKANLDILHLNDSFVTQNSQREKESVGEVLPDSQRRLAAL